MIPSQAISLAKSFEGFHRVVQRQPIVLAAPYVCPAGFWTIGFGHLCPQDHRPITEEQGEAFLAADLEAAFAATLRYCPGLAGEGARLAALVDFTFNLGAGRLKVSTLRKRVNARDWPGAAREIRKWVWGGGKKLPGLVLRREAEAALLA